MTYSEWFNNATIEERTELNKRIVAIIGTKEEAAARATDCSERIKARFEWDKQRERLAKVFIEKGDKALAMAYTQSGNNYKGVTASGKHWIMYGNMGGTERSRYCGTLYIEGEGAVFTSGRIDKAFEYILTH